MTVFGPFGQNETLTYTPESETIASDTFTYTTEIVIEVQTITTEEGSVTVTNTSAANSEMDFGELKAFPSAFGGGSQATGEEVVRLFT